MARIVGAPSAPGSRRIIAAGQKHKEETRR
ncbi:hypothetical protein BPA30113_04727 [Burkholderia paludis]|uniref:Uncharacterized protein n=1 Tax=Burkholderia paludis TaxID=1506587 RepID=A0A6P2P1I5_9BURK|nr:hypothetical protein LMG30113_03050 [Burkholderia paludis]VWC00912.1 hypothetical protein BPA30113_04727 [Burkholderia paludis]